MVEGLLFPVAGFCLAGSGLGGSEVEVVIKGSVFSSNSDLNSEAEAGSRVPASAKARKPIPRPILSFPWDRIWRAARLDSLSHE